MNINLLIKRLSKFAFLCFLVALGTTNTKAQLSPSSQSNIVVPNTLSGCARDTILLRVTNLTGPSCVPSGSASDITYQVTIPGGVEITYLTGSLFSKTAGVSPSFVGYSSNVLTFTVPAPSLGYTTTVGFVVAATCNVTAVSPLPEFDGTANYPTGFTPVSETWKSAKMNVGLGQLTLRNHCAWHGPSFNSSACNQKEYTQVVGFGANLGDYVDIENTGFGSITDIEYNVVVDDSLYWFYNATQSGASANVPINTNQFQYFYSWNAPAYSSCSNCDKWLGTGVGGGNGYTADVTVSTYGGKRWYKFNIRPQTLGGNGQFDPGEIMRFPLYLRAPKTCVPDQKVLRWVTYKCANGTDACQKSDTFTTNFKISAGIPIISVQNKQVQTWDGCQNKTASFTFVNTGTPMSGFPEVSTAYDLELKVAIGGKMDIKNLTFAGVTTVPTIETFPGVANNITWKIKDQLTFDPDGPGGLTDLDGDGFYDEIRPGDSIKVSFTYSVPCDGVACGADLYYNITGVSAFTDYCRKLNGTGSVPIYEFGFKQIAPTVQVTPLPNFGTMGLRALQTRTGTFNLNYKSININTSGATAKLRINYSKTMMVVEPISFLGVSRSLSAFTAVGTGDVTPATSTAAGYADTGSYAGPVGKRYDNDSALEYTLTAAEIDTLLNGISDQLIYSLTHIACDSFQNQRNTDNFQIIFTMGTTCPAPPPPCGLDLVCKKSFSYNVSEGCGSFPCYRASDSLFRYGRTGFTNENLSTPQAATAAGTSKMYPGDTFVNRSTYILSGNVPLMEPTGSFAASNWLGKGFRMAFGMHYDKPKGLEMTDLVPHHTFIPNLSQIRVYDTTGPGRTLLYTIPLNYTHFYNWNGVVSTKQWTKLEFADDDMTNYSTTGATNSNAAPGIGLGDYYCFYSSRTIDPSSCPYKDTRWREINSNLYHVMRNDADNRVSEYYYPLLEKAIYDAGVVFDPGYTKYQWEVDMAWRINPDYPQQNIGQIKITNDGIYRGGNEQSLPYEGRTLVGVCNGTTSVGTVVSKDLLVEGGGAVYEAACGLNVCNKLFYKSATGDYFPSPEVRVPFKLDSVIVLMPTEYHTTAAPVLSGSNGGPSNGLSLTGTSSGGGLTGKLKFTNNTGVTGTSYSDFPRISDADGGLTAWSICYPISNAGTDNLITESYKVPAKYYVKDEDGNAYVIIDTFSITEAKPVITLAPLGGSATVDDGMTCTPSFMDVLVSNNTIYAAQNAWITAMGNSDVTLLGFEDRGEVDDPITNPADTNHFSRYGFNNIYAELGGMKAGGRRIVRIYFNTASCNGSIKLISNFGCNYPASRSPEYPSNTIDSATITFTANPPKVLMGVIGGNKNITDLCSQQVIEVEIRNVSNPNLKNILTGYKLPSNVSYVTGTAQIAYPNNVYATAPTVTINSSDSLTVNVSSDLNLANACGLKGIDEISNGSTIPQNSVKVRITVEFNNCPLGSSSPIFIGTQAQNYCGTLTKTTGVINFIYVGNGGTPSSFICKSLPSSSITVCAAKNQTVKINDRLYVKNIGTGASTTLDTMEITVGIDTSRMTLSNFALGSPWTGMTTTLNPQGRTVVKVPVPSGISINDSLVLPLTYDLTPKVDEICDNPSATCSDISHSISFYSVPVLNCPSKGISGCVGVGKLTKGTGFVPRDIQCCAALGNYVWLDDDKDGIQDASEQGVAGVTVSLIDNTGKVVATTVTDAYGKYLFSDLTPGTYSVQFTQPANYTFTTQTNNTTNGSDVNPNNGRTASVTLVSGETNLNLDAGLIQAPPIGQNVGDYVWLDTDKDGIQDAGEDGIAGVTVTLYDASGNIIGTTVTDGTGKYNFANVPAGTYTVGFTPPIGLVGTTQTSGTATGSDMSPSTFKTASFTVTSGTDRTDIDAGFYPQDDNKAALGDLVWNDLDNDGTQDAGEPGVAGVTVTLYNSGGSPIATTQTDAFGNYVFNDLAPGTYSVGFSGLPSGFALSPQNTGGGPADSMDSDANTGTGRTGNYTLVAGERNMSVDAGIFKSGANYTLGNYVWLDTDKDGIQDAAEAGIAGIMMVLKDATGNPIDTTYTDENGYYLFTNLGAGSYSVQAKNLPSGLNITTKDQTAGGGNDANDNDADGSGSTGQVTLGPGNPNDMTLDIGVQPAPSNTFTASLGNRIWFDGDADGIQDAQEPGIAGVKVYLYAADGTTKLDSTLTDGKGEYMFTGLPAGDYIVGAVLPSGFNVSAAGAGSDPTADNNGNAPISGISKSNLVSLANGQENLSIDFGINKPTALIVGNKVWLDSDKDGVQDVGEPGVPNIGVRLLDAFGNTVGTTITDANGNYLFVDVPAGNDYTIQFINLPVGYVFTAKDSSSATDITDSDASKANGLTNRFNVTGANTWTTNDATTQLSYDAGIYPETVAAVSGTYWVDANKDGIQDPTELGIPGMRVTLYDNSGNPVASTITDANGNYLFPNVSPGNGYSVGFEAPPSGSSLTAQNATGSNSTNNSDADPTSLRTAPFNLAAGELKPDLDAGIITPITGSLGDKIWLDNDADGQQDASEPGVPGVVLELLDNAGNVIATTVTDGNGNYLFSNLPAGTYKVRMADLPGNLQSTNANLGPDATDSDFDAISLTTGNITLAEGENRRDIDGGLIAEKAQLGNYVWLDDDKDGIQDVGEMGVAGVTVTLFNAAGNPVASTVTDAYGKYIFKNLAPTTYSVQFTPPANYEFTTQTTGTTDGSDVNPISGRTNTVTLSPGDSNMTLDAGLIQSVPNGQNVGDYVWYDTDKDGIQDAGEAGIAGVTVTLYDNAGNAIASTITDNTGKYNFANVPAGSYTVGFTPPIGLVGTTQTSGTATGSDMSPSTFKTASFTVTSGTDRTDIDAGFYQQDATKAALGNLVWNDLNNNGTQDAGEPGVAGVTVTLYNSGGSPIATTQTDAFGNYVFNDLAPGTYSVGFSGLPSGFALVSANTGGSANDSLDSDANTGTGRTGNYTLAAGEKNMSVDAGIFKSGANYTLGNYVWLDTDKDGAQDAGEAGVAGVMVILRNSSGTPVDTTYTDANGKYLFTNLAAGAYSVQVKNTPSGLVITSKDATSGGTTDATDSDADPSGATATVTLGPGNPNDMSLDIGLMPAPGSSYTASLGNKLWFDGDGDGIQDAGEPGLPGVKVYLYAADGVTKLDSTITDGKGEYIFTGLPAADYFVGVVMPSGYSTTPKAIGGDPTADNNANTPVAGISKSDKVSLGLGEENLSIDFGINKAGALIVGDKVFLDANKNGMDDGTPSEPGVSGIGVRLLDGAGNIIATTITDANGNYLFVDVPLGSNYRIQFTNLPTGYVFSAKDTSIANDLTDSDPNKNSGFTDPFTVTPSYTWTTNPSATQRSYDAGIYPQTVAAVSGTYWVDQDSDGIQDAAEPGITGMRVTLYDNGGNPVASVITDANGNYLFPNVTPGNGYTVGFEPAPAGTVITTQNATGSNSSNNSDVDLVNRRTAPFNLAAGELKPDLDAGVKTIVPASLGNKIWFDANQDGIQDPTERGVPGVLLQLLDNAGNVVATTVTDENGNYLFANLTPGTYSVKMVLPPNTMITRKDVGGNNAADNDFDKNTLKTAPVTLLAGENNTSVDGGIIPQAYGTIGSFVFNDLAVNGISDNSPGNIDPGIVGVKIYLYDMATNTIIDSTVTITDGYYRFDSLPQGDYRLHFVSPPGMRPTFQNIRNNTRDSLDSDVDTTTGFTNVIKLLTNKDTNLYIYAGFTTLSPLSINWLNFTATNQTDFVLLNWRVGAEENTKYYYVMRRLSSETEFRTIGQVTAAGNSSIPLSYTFTDYQKEVFSANVYYQIQAVHANNKNENSEIRMVNFGKPANAEYGLQIWPNPANTNINIAVNTEEGFTWNLLDINGRTVFTGQSINSTTTVDVSNLPSGVYLVKVQNAFIDSTEKVIISR